MEQKKNLAYLQVALCYAVWGFQPLYWNMAKDIDSVTLLAFRIISASFTSLILLTSQKRLGEIKLVLTNKNIIKYVLPATLFMGGDWMAYLYAIREGRLIEASIGYYISPLFMFIIGVLVYKEQRSKWRNSAILIALCGIAINVISFGKLPLFSLVVATIWSTYASVTKSIKLDGVLSIAIETLILSVFAILFLIFFRPEQALFALKEHFFLVLGAGIVTALPMYLYSNCISVLPLIVVCFFQYLTPTFNILCGLLFGERFTTDQLINLSFFIISIIVFTIGEVKRIKQK